MPQATNTSYDFYGQALPYNGSINNINSFYQQYNIKGASLSSGLYFSLSAGHQFNDHVGIQLDGNIGLSNTKYSSSQNHVTVSSVLSTVTLTHQATTPVFITPSLVVKTGGDPWNLYCRMGVVLPLRTAVEQHQIIVNEPGTGATQVDDFTLKIKNYFSLGISAAAGVEYKLSEQMSLWGEVGVLSMSQYIKQSTVSAITVNGQSYPTSALSGPLTTNYSKNPTVDTNNTNLPTYAQPFSNFSFTIGVRYNLSAPHHKRSSAHTDEGYDRNKPYRRR